MNNYMKLVGVRVRMHCRSGVVIEGCLVGFEFEYESCGFLIRLEDAHVRDRSYLANGLPWVLVNPDAVDFCFPADKREVTPLPTGENA